MRQNRISRFVMILSLVGWAVSYGIVNQRETQLNRRIEHTLQQLDQLNAAFTTCKTQTKTLTEQTIRSLQSCASELSSNLTALDECVQERNTAQDHKASVSRHGARDTPAKAHAH